MRGGGEGRKIAAMRGGGDITFGFDRSLAEPLHQRMNGLGVVAEPIGQNADIDGASAATALDAAWLADRQPALERHP